MKTISIQVFRDLDEFNEFIESHFAQNAKGINYISRLIEDEPTVVYLYNSHTDFEEFCLLDDYLATFFGSEMSSIQDPRDAWLDESDHVCVIGDFGCSGIDTGITREMLEDAFLD